jgi:hypothetical protein
MTNLPKPHSRKDTALFRAHQMVRADRDRHGHVGVALPPIRVNLGFSQTSRRPCRPAFRAYEGSCAETHESCGNIKARAARVAAALCSSPNSTASVATRLMTARAGERQRGRLLRGARGRHPASVCSSVLVAAGTASCDVIAGDLAIAFVASRKRNLDEGVALRVLARLHGSGDQQAPGDGCSSGDSAACQSRASAIERSCRGPDGTA